MLQMLRDWWNVDEGVVAAKVAEAQARIDAAPAGSWIAVENGVMPFIKSNVTPQTITRDGDIKELSRAVFVRGNALRSGRIRTLNVGMKCEQCGQCGLAYCHRGDIRIAVCSHVEAGLTEFFARTRRECGCYDNGEEEEAILPGTLVFRGMPVESVPCGRSIWMSLIMRHCWFETTPNATPAAPAPTAD